jgi:hypothetical protein
MVPGQVVLLEALPLTPNGKVDRKALPAPDPAGRSAERPYVAPRTPVERELAAVWADVLGLPAGRVGVDDNFFELGGDSILSIQVVARAARAGVRLTPRQLFQHQTVAALAAVAGVGPALQAEQGPLDGPLPLTPIQHWFLEQDLAEPHHWNQAHLVEARRPLDGAALAGAVRCLLEHHDALRLRFHRGPGGWEQAYTLPADADAPPDEGDALRSVELSALPAEAQEREMAAAGAAAQASLDLAGGPLLRIVHFRRGPGGPDRLLIAIHHLVVDAVSWRILLEDLQTAYLALLEGRAPRLAPKTTSFRQWATRLVEHARSSALQTEAEYWTSCAETVFRPLPVDFHPESGAAGGEANTEGDARAVTVELTPEETHALLNEVPAAYRTRVDDVLLTALTQAFASRTGSPSLLVDLEGHGRDALFEDVDLSRTVGWFTALFPVGLTLEGGVGGPPGEALKAIKEQLRRVPAKGIGYGLLRYLSGDAAVGAPLREGAQPEVSFNYLGRGAPPAGEEALFDLCAAP